MTSLSNAAVLPPQPIDPSPAALVQAIPCHADSQPTIFDMLGDLRQTFTTIEAFVLANPSCITSTSTSNGWTPLHDAAQKADIVLIKFFLDQGVGVESRGHVGETPLMVSCERGSLYAVHVLVEGGADVTAVDTSGKTAMHHVALTGAVHIMHYLAETRNLGFRDVDNQGNTPLHLAVYRRRLECVKYLLRNKRADRCAANKKGNTAMHLAVKHLSGELVWRLLSTSNRKKLLTAKDENGCTPYEMAALGATSKHKLLAQKLGNWSKSSAYMRRLPWLVWGCFAMLPALALLLALFLLSFVHQPFGLILALVVAWTMFFMPITIHRIAHDVGWQNPTSMMGVVIGFFFTALCYWMMVVPRLWPSNCPSLIVLLFTSLYGMILFYRLKRTNPGHVKVGRLDEDGKRLTIVDVARQGNAGGPDLMTHTHASPDSYAFCTYCEIVIPDRSKHCKLCNACCYGFDHHCMWLTSCIGYNNHRLFVLFLKVLALANFIFLYQSFWLFSVVAGGSYNIWTLLVIGCTEEHWVMLMVICNFVSGVFAVMNLLGQLSHISRLETTFFDISGRAAYNKSRERNPISLYTRLHLVYLFFADYKRWYNRPTLRSSSACYPKFNA